MQLRVARLCLNCEEIHTGSHCPICASESFAYVSRWIPPEERRQESRAGQPPRTGPATAAPPRMRWVKRGAAGVAVLAASRLLWQLSRPVEWSDGTDDEDQEDRRGGPFRPDMP